MGAQNVSGRRPMVPSDRDWIIPAAILTVLLGIVALGLTRLVHLEHPAAMLFSLAGWFFWTLAALGLAVIIETLKLMRRGESHPVAEIWRTRANLHWTPILAGMALAGLDMFFFMWIKPELNVIFPFWADAPLAAIDYAIFGTDPWRLLTWIGADLMSALYSFGWFFSVELTFFWLMLKRPSRDKTVAVIAYFLLWSIFGPIGQALLSSAGPIFFDKLGLGDRFLLMPRPHVTGAIADYLWMQYQVRGAGVGVGISAMPSLHVGSMMWMILTFASFRSKWTQVAAALTLYIWAGSVLLGWHYVTDGIAGAIGAVVCFLCARYLRRRSNDHAVDSAPDEVRGSFAVNLFSDRN